MMFSIFRKCYVPLDMKWTRVDMDNDLYRLFIDKAMCMFILRTFLWKLSHSVGAE